ncbi:MAG: peptidoglycan synthetase [Bacteroidetes bacterium]|nr:peptidoglycan synthetase [Bacteroidota bacterium]
MTKVHFIAIGGSAMHNLAIALHLKGFLVTGSDDEIYEPAKSRLLKYGLLPDQVGWRPSFITAAIDAIILGMHAKADNPELARAKELNLKIFSYPEFLYEQSKEKKRIVIGGSHGKTTITAMILHVLKHYGITADYLVGAQLEGFDVMVKLTEEAPLMVFEGDEYLTSPIDTRPKFHLYQPHIALLSGIAWDHINVFQTFDKYLDQFKIFINLIPSGGLLIYCQEDEVLQKLVVETNPNIRKIPYDLPAYTVKDGQTRVEINRKSVPLKVFGKHNLLNLQGALQVCLALGVSSEQFATAISTFRGASRRLEIIGDNGNTRIFRDFAHAPSKLQATIQAVKEQYPGHELVACMELHTYSSLSSQFLSHYTGTMDQADHALVYYNPHALQIKRLPTLSAEDIQQGFGRKGLKVYTDSSEMVGWLRQTDWNDKNLLLMSSGDFDGIDMKTLAEELLSIH